MVQVLLYGLTWQFICDLHRQLRQAQRAGMQCQTLQMIRKQPMQGVCDPLSASLPRQTAHPHGWARHAWLP